MGFINTRADNELLDQNFDGVARAIAALPRRERDVLLLKYDQGYGNSEIGKLLGLRPDHISQIAHRAKEHLRKNLEEMGVEV